MVLQLRRWLPDWVIVVVVDSPYAVPDLHHRCQRLPNPVTVITRLRLDAALYDPPPERTAATKGQPRRKGTRQPTLAARVSDPRTAWERMSVRCYGGTQREVEVPSETALWYHGGLPTVPVRWVLIRDPPGHFDPQAPLATDQSLTPPQIVEWFVLRWQLEVTFHEARCRFRLETDPVFRAKTDPPLGEPGPANQGGNRADPPLAIFSRRR